MTSRPTKRTSPVGAVVVTYRTTPEQLLSCLTSLRENGIKEISLISNDQRNIGFAAAANQAALKLASEFILFLNPDARLEPGAAGKAVELLRQERQIGIVGLLLCNSKLQAETNCFGPRVNAWSILSRHFLSPAIPTEPTLVGWVSGGAILVRQTIWQELGGFDNRFFMYWEDVDLCHRATQAGWEVKVIPSARVVHERGSSWKDITHQTRCYDQSADKFFQKHYPKPIWLGQRYGRIIYRWLVRSAV